MLEQLQERRRYLEIDGLRGWACVSVMLSHLFFGVFNKAAPPLSRRTGGR
jgi:peptidoglycan/LPS O-acetylase OafA/YrhL